MIYVLITTFIIILLLLGSLDKITEKARHFLLSIGYLSLSFLINKYFENVIAPAIYINLFFLSLSIFTLATDTLRKKVTRYSIIGLLLMFLVLFFTEQVYVLELLTIFLFGYLTINGEKKFSNLALVFFLIPFFQGYDYFVTFSLFLILVMLSNILVSVKREGLIPVFLLLTTFDIFLIQMSFEKLMWLAPVVLILLFFKFVVEIEKKSWEGVLVFISLFFSVYGEYENALFVRSLVLITVFALERRKVSNSKDLGVLFWFPFLLFILPDSYSYLSQWLVNVDFWFVHLVIVSSLFVALYFYNGSLEEVKIELSGRSFLLKLGHFFLIFGTFSIFLITVGNQIYRNPIVNLLFLFVYTTSILLFFQIKMPVIKTSYSGLIKIDSSKLFQALDRLYKVLISSLMIPIITCLKSINILYVKLIDVFKIITINFFQTDNSKYRHISFGSLLILLSIWVALWSSF